MLDTFGGGMAMQHAAYQWIVWALVQEYQKFVTFAQSLLSRSTRLADLIGQLEIELGDKDPETIEGKRVKKPHASNFSTHYASHMVARCHSNLSIVLPQEPQLRCDPKVSAGLGGLHRNPQRPVCCLRDCQAGHGRPSWFHHRRSWQARVPWPLTCLITKYAKISLTWNTSTPTFQKLMLL